MRIQPKLKPLHGKMQYRENLGAGVMSQIKLAVSLEAQRYDCSKAFVVATILAAHFGISEQADYTVGAKVQPMVGSKKRRSA